MKIIQEKNKKVLTFKDCRKRQSFGGDCRFPGCNFLRKDSEPGIHGLASGIHKSYETVGQMLYVFTFSKRRFIAFNRTTKWSITHKNLKPPPQKAVIILLKRVYS